MLFPVRLVAPVLAAALLAAVPMHAQAQTVVALGAGDGTTVDLETAKRCAGFYAFKDSLTRARGGKLSDRDSLVAQAWGMHVAMKLDRRDAKLGEELFEQARSEVLSQKNDANYNATAITLGVLDACGKLERVENIEDKPDAS